MTEHTSVGHTSPDCHWVPRVPFLVYRHTRRLKRNAAIISCLPSCRTTCGSHTRAYASSASCRRLSRLGANTEHGVHERCTCALTQLCRPPEGYVGAYNRPLPGEWRRFLLCSCRSDTRLGGNFIKGFIKHPSIGAEEAQFVFVNCMLEHPRGCIMMHVKSLF